MNKIKKNSTLFGLRINLAIGIVLMLLLYMLKIKALTTIGYITIVSFLFIIILNFLNKISAPINKKVFIPFLLLIMFNSYNLIYLHTAKSIYNYMMQNLMFLFIYVMSIISISERNVYRICFVIRKFYYCYIFIVSILFFINKLYLVDQFVRIAMYKVILSLLFFVLIISKNIKFDIVIAMIFFFITGERTSMIIVLIIYFIYSNFNKISKNKFIYKLVFIVTTIFTVLIPYVYIWLEKSIWGLKINDFFIKYTGEQFFSGRNTIWKIIIPVIEEKKIMGWGIGNTILVDNGILVSTHNLYLYILLQGGIIFLILFIMLIYSLWNQYYNYVNNKIVKLSATFLLSIMIFLDFEMVLIANDIVISIYLWLVFGIGIMIVNNLKEGEIKKYG